MVGYLLASSRFLCLTKSSTSAAKALDLSGGDQHAPANAHGLQLSRPSQPMKASFANSQNFHRIASREHARRAFVACLCPVGGHVLILEAIHSCATSSESLRGSPALLPAASGSKSPLRLQENR
jgi:hypothetical protein